jgi:hypothetical protein
MNILQVAEKKLVLLPAGTISTLINTLFLFAIKVLFENYSRGIP